MPTVLVARVAVSLRALDTNSTCAKNVRRNEGIYGKRYQTESAGAYFQTGKPAQGTDASGIFTAGADDRAGTAADFDVPLTEDGCSQREIAENCHLDVTTLSRTLDRLAEKGLLERRINPQSRRECQIFLTEEGRETAAEVCSCFRETEKKMCSGLTEKELEALDAGICRMLENLTEA